MSIAIVNSYATPNTYGASLTQAISAVGPGNALVVVVTSPNNGQANVTSVKTSGNAPLALDYWWTAGGCGIYRINNVTGGPTSVTATASANDALSLTVFEVSGLAASPVDFATVLANDGFITTHANPFTTAAAGELIVGVMGAAVASTSAPYSYYATGANNLCVVYGIVTSAGANTLNYTLSAANNSSPAAVAYQTGVSLPTYSLGDVTVDHAAGTAAVPVTLSAAAPAGGFSVNLQTADGTATSPAYYTAKSGSVSIPAGQTSGTFVVAINP